MVGFEVLTLEFELTLGDTPFDILWMESEYGNLDQLHNHYEYERTLFVRGDYGARLFTAYVYVVVIHGQRSFNVRSPGPSRAEKSPI